MPLNPAIERAARFAAFGPSLMSNVGSHDEEGSTDRPLSAPSSSAAVRVKVRLQCVGVLTLLRALVTLSILHVGELQEAMNRRAVLENANEQSSRSI